MKFASYLLWATVLMVAPSVHGQQDDSRLELLNATKGSDAVVARFMHETWPGDSLLKVSSETFRLVWSTAPQFEEGRSLRADVRQFRRMQDVLLGLTTKRNSHLPLTQPVPSAGMRAWVPPRHPLDANLDEVEPNDSIAQANAMACGDVMTGCTNLAGDDDYFVMTLTNFQVVSARVDPTTSAAHCNSSHTDARLELLDAAGTTLAFNDDFNGLFPQIDIFLGPGTYYWVVDGFSTATGDYEFAPTCSTPTILGCGAGTGSGTIANPGETATVVVAVPADGLVTIDVLAMGGLDASATLLDRDGVTEITTARHGAANYLDARLEVGLRAGQYFMIVSGANETTGSFGLSMTCGGPLPDVSCGGSRTTTVTPEKSPLFNVNGGALAGITATVDDLGAYFGSVARVVALDGTTLTEFVGDAPAPGTYDLSAIATPGAGLRLTAQNVVVIAERTWQPSNYAKQWCRPVPSAGPYAGPTNLNVNSGGFTFVDDHLTPAGILTVRKYREFDMNAGAWDSGTFIDECYVDVDTGSGPVRFHPVDIRLDAENGVDWQLRETVGTMADVAADDGVYFAVNLADGTRAGRDAFSVEFDFDLSSLGATGSQITDLSFYAEWYFGGNSSVFGGTSSPPTFDDESEEYNLYTEQVQLLRQAAGTWDVVGDVLDPVAYPPPPGPPTGDGVIVSNSCDAIPTQAISKEDVDMGTITSSLPFQGYLLETGTPADVVATTDTVAYTAEQWRDQSYAQDWSYPNANYPGPIVQSTSAALPADVVGSGGVMRVRFVKDNCWESTTWDDAHYYDLVELSVDTGGGPNLFYPMTLTQQGDIGRFGSSGVSFGGGTIADLAADDDTYGLADAADYDATTFGPATQYWDEFEFDVSALLGAGGGNAITNLGITMEVYLRGGGFSATPGTSADSSEELNLVSVDVQLYDFATGTWIDVDPTPIIDPGQYVAPPTCSSLGLDTQLYAYDAGTLAFLGSDDDGGTGLDSRLAVSAGVQTTLFIVAASPGAAAGRETGTYDLTIEAPFGFAGDSSFQVSLGSSFTVRTRGTDGDRSWGYVSHAPNLSLGIPLPPVNGNLIVNLSGLLFVTPNGGTITGGILDGATLPIPVDPVLLGTSFYGQGLQADAGLTTLTFATADRVTVTN